MVSRNGKENFLVAHYEWLALGVALAALAVSVLMAQGVLGGSEEDADSGSPRPRREGIGVAAVNLSEFQRAMSLTKKPPVVAGVSDKGGNFLTCEGRVFCFDPACRAAMPIDAKKCPVCGKAPPEKVKVVYDTDEDGMPDEWEGKYGLNIRSAADADEDLDGDGFTNLEEFQAKTDPKDAKSHPDYLDSLKLVLPLKETFMPFYFTGAYKTPSGFKYSFKDPRRSKEYDRGVYSVLEGGEIGATGFIAKGYEAKTKKVKIGGGMEKTVEASEATVVRKSDGRELKLGVNVRQVPLDSQARLVYTRMGVKEFMVVAGDEIELNGTKYTVKAVKRVGKGASVTVEPKAGGKARTLEALEQ